MARDSKHESHDRESNTDSFLSSSRNPQKLHSNGASVKPSTQKETDKSQKEKQNNHRKDKADR